MANRKTGMLIIGGLVVGFLAGAAAAPAGLPAKIAILINGMKLTAPGGWVIRGSELVGPVNPIIKALGAKATWNAQAKTFDIKSPARWPVVAHQSEYGRNNPYSFTPLGPVMRVRHELSERQWASMRESDPNEPVLARFEIVDAVSYSGLNGKESGPLEEEVAPFKVRAVLYWVYLSPARDIGRQGFRLIRARGQDNKYGFSQDGPRVKRVRLQTIEYYLTPKETEPVKQAGAYMENVSSAEALIMGKTGWEVYHVEDVSQEMLTIRERNDVAPLYDPSAQAYAAGAVAGETGLPKATQGGGMNQGVAGGAIKRPNTTTRRFAR
jgi:hypothetical protein